jgi:hypothetical protein
MADWRDGINTFCPECGVNVKVDEDGCCATCGATATGNAVWWLNGVVDKLDAAETLIMMHQGELQAASFDGLKDGDKMPTALAMICKVLQDTLDDCDEAENYISWCWKDGKTDKEYNIVVGYADGEPPAVKASRLQAELDKHLAEE